jgi:hypothetical protein
MYTSQYYADRYMHSALPHEWHDACGGCRSTSKLSCRFSHIGSCRLHMLALLKNGCSLRPACIRSYHMPEATGWPRMQVTAAIRCCHVSAKPMPRRSAGAHHVPYSEDGKDDFMYQHQAALQRAAPPSGNSSSAGGLPAFNCELSRPDQGAYMRHRTKRAHTTWTSRAHSKFNSLSRVTGRSQHASVTVAPLQAQSWA